MKTILSFLLLISSSESLLAESSRNTFLGIQPAITIEPFYEEGEFDINILPLVYETRINNRMNIRLLPMVNYHFGGLEAGISDVGIFTVLPIFLKSTDKISEKPYGFYLGPVIGFGRNMLNDHYTTTIAIEPGYLFEADNSFTICLGLQLGSSYFTYDNQPEKFVFHWGPKISFGFWLN